MIDDLDTHIARFTEAVETATGRKVRAFLSQIHFDPDISCEIFVLEPDGSAEDPIPTT